ncbi:recQ-mediated genome instability protein 1-like [Haliotis asinina]|uniref:recQ-mediated genome instability protein 1-like n=1 Tax=Haliotis asinina TaxID=109174 RepID=UPI0035326771
MMMNHVGALKTWLKTSYCVSVPEDWLEACLEWIQEENPGSDVNLESLKNQVYEQWLMSDLRELKMGCLPFELLEARKIEISGIFALQIDSAVNVGSSFYSQGQKIKGTENPNAQVSAEDTRQPAWEPKPTRMIILNLTDGVSDVKGMEYKPVAALTPFITPGTKMLVKGRVLCRRGMLMLGPENVQILGGEVDSLMETHTPEAVLAAAMQVGQTNEGKCERQEFSGHMLSKGEEKKGVASMHHPVTTPRSAPVFKQENIKTETVQHSTQPYNSTRNMSVGRQGSTTMRQTSVKSEMPDADDWGDDFDYDALMADMEEESTAQATTRVQQPTRQIKVEPPSQPTSSGRSTSHTDHIVEDVFMDDFDDDFDMHTSFSRTIKREIKQEPISQPSRTVTNNKVVQNPERRLDSNRPNENALISRNQSVSTGTDQIRSTGEVGEGPESRSTGEIGFTSQSRPSVNQRNKHFDRDKKSGSAYVVDEDFEEDFDFDSCDVEANNTSCSFTGVQAKRMRLNIPAKDKQNYETACTKHKTKPGPDDGQVCSKTDVPKAVIHPFPNKPNTKTVGSTTTVPSNLGSRTAPKKQGQSRMDRFLGGGSSPGTSAPAVQENFIYLSEILRKMPVTETKEFVIKGYISTLTSKLTSCQGKTWSLSCKINDGTAALNVDLSNSVLTKLIGFSAEDSVVMKQRAKRDPTVKDVLTEGLQQCQQQLTDLSSLMKIQFQPHQLKPVLCQIMPVTSGHLQCLYNQVISKILTER